MATYEKPTSVPRWADSGSVLEPSEGKKDEGWVADEVPPAEWENWKGKLIGEWFKWIDERVVDTDSGNGWSILNPATEDVAFGLSNQSGPGMYPFLWTELEEIQFIGDGTDPTLTFQTDTGHEAWISYDRVLDYMWFEVHSEDVLLLTKTSARFRAGHTLFPATTGTGKIGDASYYWASAYINRIFESSPLLWHGYLSADVVLVNAVEAAITPGSVIALNDIAVASKQISFAEKGLYRISCDFAVLMTGASGYLIIKAYLKTVGVTNSVQQSYIDSAYFKVIHYETVVAISDHTDQYVEIRGLVASSGLNTMTIAGGSGDQIYSHMTVTPVYLAP